VRRSVDEVRPEGAKIKVVMSPKGEIEITGNQLGLKALSRICATLSESTEEYGNHYHLMDVEGFWGTEPGSIPLVIYREEF
jgi:hypothetical protein